MDRNTVIGLLLMLALLLGFGFWNGKKTREFQEQQAKEQSIKESFKSEETTTAHFTDSTINHQSDTVDAALKQTVERKVASPFYQGDSEYNASDYVEIHTDIATYSVAKKGGYLAIVEFNEIMKTTGKGDEREKLKLFDGENHNMSLELMLPNQSVINTKDYQFYTETGVVQIDENTQELSMKLIPVVSTDSGSVPAFDSYLEYLYVFRNGEYEVGFDIHFVNMTPYLYPSSNNFSLNWNAILKSSERNFEYEQSITTAYFMDNLNEVDNLSEKGSDSKEFSSDFKWCSFKQQFFTAVLIADSSYFSSGEVEVVAPTGNTAPVLKSLAAILDFKVADADNGSFNMSFFVGPNQYRLLKEYDLNLERQVPLGWGFLIHWINRLAVIPVFDWLSAYDLSFGLIILIITIILKLVLLPIAYKTYMSSAKMRALKPEIDEINGRYPKQEDAMKKQQAVMGLYKSAGASPLAGCLPVLLQLPILFALFRFFPAAYELRQQPFLWADDLSSYDSILELGFQIPFYGDHVSLFCLLMTVATLAYTWINNKFMTPASGNADQMKMMRIFMYIMPIMFLGFFNNFASGLTYYYFLVNIITFVQMGAFKLFIDEKKIREKLLLNMQKPQKKSKWQKKMEEMMKQQQQMQQQQGGKKRK